MREDHDDLKSKVTDADRERWGLNAYRDPSGRIYPDKESYERAQRGIRGEFADQDMPAPKMKYPDGNPKTQFGIAKPDLWSIDPIALYVMGLAMLQGNLKYGLYNYFDDPVSVSTYANAAQRHLDLYKLGQDLASDTLVEHLGHIMACASILISAHYHGKLIDDRTKNIQMAEDLDKFFTDKQPLVKQIRDQWTGFAEKQLALKGKTDGNQGSKSNG